MGHWWNIDKFKCPDASSGCGFCRRFADRATKRIWLDISCPWIFMFHGHDDRIACESYKFHLAALMYALVEIIEYEYGICVNRNSVRTTGPSEITAIDDPELQDGGHEENHTSI